MLSYKQFLTEVGRTVLPLPKYHPFPQSPHTLGKLQLDYLRIKDHHELEYGKPFKPTLMKVPVDKVFRTENKTRSVKSNNDVYRKTLFGKDHVSTTVGYSLFPDHKHFPVMAKVHDSYHIMEGHHRSTIRKHYGKGFINAHVYDLTPRSRDSYDKHLDATKRQPSKLKNALYKMGGLDPYKR